MIQNYKVQLEVIKENLPEGITEEEIKLQCEKYIEDGIDIMTVANNCNYIKIKNLKED